MKTHIREKINAALAARSMAPVEAQRLPSAPDRRAIVEGVLASEKFWDVHEIASRLHLDYTSVYRALKGRPGWLRFGRAIRITDELYQQFIREAVNRGLADRN